ncbi:uncharacterized protein LOC122961485 [Acropora millepora]|uniref:uncharacterized protein LOC122961485 n=1 Tax=Acropora millepora TaxID=45264 RepID=UPI001CF292DF|nr:uncharacterized protein LOC122961485 [Acropora millepora]
MKKGGQVPSYAEGETESTCKEHMASLKKEMQKNSNRNLQMVKQLMEITYPYRRRMILSEPLSIPEIMDKFPALNLVTEFKLEVSRVLGSGTVKDCWEVWEENWLQKVLRLAMKTPACCYIQTTMEEALEETPEKRKDIEDSAAILFLEKMENENLSP